MDLFKGFFSSTHLIPRMVFHGFNLLHIPSSDLRNRNIIVNNRYMIERDGWRIAYLRLLAGNAPSAFCFFRDGIWRIQERCLNSELSEKSPEFHQIYDKRNKIRQPERARRFLEYST